MCFSKWFRAIVFTSSIFGSAHLFAQDKVPALGYGSKPTKPKTSSPLDTVNDALYAAHTFEQAAISPDGKKIAWVETLVGKDGAPDGNTAIYLTDRDPSSAPKRVTAASRPVSRAEGSVAWSPDSKLIAFLSDAVKPGQLQLYVLSIASGPAKKLTNVKGLLATPQWSPDGKTIAVLYTENATRAAGPLVAETPETGEIKDASSNNASPSSTSPPATSAKSLPPTCTSTNTTGRLTACTSPSSPRMAMATITGTLRSSTLSTPDLSA